MTITIPISNEDIAGYSYEAKKKIRGHRFRIDDRVNEYLPKRDGQKVFSDLAKFVALQDIIYQKIDSSTQDSILTTVSHHLSAIVTLDSLTQNNNPSCEYFHTRKIDYSPSHPGPINDTLNVYLQAMDEARPRPSLESLTQSYLEWVIQDTAQDWKNRNTETIAQQYQLLFNGKTFTPQLKFTKNEKRSTFDLAKYSSTPVSSAPSSTSKNPTTPSANQSASSIKQQNPSTQLSANTTTPTVASQASYIYGHDDFKAEFQKITTITKNREYLTTLFPPKKLFQNYLLLGPPGTGKTTLVSTLAKECGLKFYTIPCVTICSEFFSKSAQNLHEIYTQAGKDLEEKKEQGVILFFDEFDHIAKRRGYGNSTEGDSLITTLNENLDGSSTKAGLITFAASNIESVLDPAVVSRFKKFYIDYPKDDKELEGIHTTIMKKMSDYAKKPLFSQIDFSQILTYAHRDERYKSGRVIDRILTNAALHSAIKQLPQLSQNAPLKLVTTDDILQEYDAFNIEGDKVTIPHPTPGNATRTV